MKFSAQHENHIRFAIFGCSKYGETRIVKKLLCGKTSQAIFLVYGRCAPQHEIPRIDEKRLTNAIEMENEATGAFSLIPDVCSNFQYVSLSFSSIVISNSIFQYINE